MGHFSDGLHLELCTAPNCHKMADRTEMARRPGGRGWWCRRCYERKFGDFPKTPDEGQDKLY